MKIKRVEVYKADLPLKRAFRIALGEIEVARNVFIRIDTNAGLSGWGEGSSFTPIVGETQATCLKAARDLGRLILGKDPLDIENRCSRPWLRYRSFVLGGTRLVHCAIKRAFT